MKQVLDTLKESIYKLLTMIRRIIYIILGFFDSITSRQKNLITILSYHSICDDAWRFSINVEEFKKQIMFLQKHYDIIPLSVLEKYLNGKTEILRPSIILTFDDGYQDIMELRPFLKKHNIKPSLFILSDSMNANWKELGAKRKLLTKMDIRTVINDGWEIGSHTSTHPNLTKITPKELETEIINSRKTLEKELGVSVRYFAYPRGKYDKNTVQYVKKAGYSLGLTMDDGIITRNSNKLVLPRVGVDRTHSFAEFKTLFASLNIVFRKTIKTSIIGKYI